ncbi:xanthine phosphoribosyltransferase 1 [Venturia nashicola]|uniref:Xanthine phosphoribosyltransferase 1 n=1 Tax=Venturia nashicola TaxID=86259 RepID=A0A4Z1PE64_9PEZI|nr:xanthine phosphoribosyltransferase 1 [Venturia nashicola]
MLTCAFGRLTQLLENLNADEWRHVRAVARDYPLQYDIIASLPLELVAHIFSFLEVADVFQYRQVSKAWQHVLSAPNILDPLLDQWFPRSDGSELDSSPTDHKIELDQRKAEQLHRFLHGRPVVTRLIRPPSHFHIPFQRRERRDFQFVGETVVWSAQTESRRSVNLLNIRTGHVCRVSLPGTQHLEDLVLTKTHLVCSTRSNYVFTFELSHTQTCHTSGRYEYLKAPYLVTSLGADDDTCVLVCGRLVVVWDMNLNTSHSFDLPLPANSRFTAVVVNAASRYMTLLPEESGEGNPIVLCHYRVDFAGTTLSPGTGLEMLLQEGMSVEPTNNLRLIDHQRRFRIPLRGSPRFLGELYLVERDNHVIVCDSFQGPQNDTGHGEGLPDWADLEWKTASYCQCSSYRQHQNELNYLDVEICDTRNGSRIQRDLWEKVPSAMRLSIAQDVLDPDGDEYGDDFTVSNLVRRKDELLASINIIGNQDFVIVLSSAFIYIMAFDPAFRFGYEDVDFPTV